MKIRRITTFAGEPALEISPGEFGVFDPSVTVSFFRRENDGRRIYEPSVSVFAPGQTTPEIAMIMARCLNFSACLANGTKINWYTTGFRDADTELARAVLAEVEALRCQ